MLTSFFMPCTPSARACSTSTSESSSPASSFSEMAASCLFGDDGECELAYSSSESLSVGERGPACLAGQVSSDLVSSNVRARSSSEGLSMAA